MTRHRQHHRHRSGFTLMELLIVFTLIMLLVGISLVTMRGAITTAREKATQTTILKIHGLVQQRMEAFDRAVDRLNLTASKQKLKLNFNQTYGQATNIYLSDNSKVLDVMVKKQLLQSRFPQNFAERPLAASASHNPVTQSSALLYWLLTNSEVFGIAPVDDSEFTSSEVRDTDGDGLKEFVDGWGRPLRFYRCPTQLFRPGISTGAPGATGSSALSPIDRRYVSALWSGLPAPPPEDVNGNGVLDPGEDLNGNGTLETFDIDPLMRDPGDPTAQLYQLAALDTSGTIMTGIQDLFNTPSTYYAFLIVSAGPDGILGLAEPFDYLGTSNPSQTAPATTTFPALQIPMVSSPALGGAQGRLGALDPNYGSLTLDQHPINDNLTNRKR